MCEHRIRLRGGWDWLVPGTTGPPRRVNLPLDWPEGPTPAVRLVRRFGRPPIAGGPEPLRLHLARVAGLTAAWLNDREIARPGPGIAELLVCLDGPLRVRNLLVLEVDDPALIAGSRADWGHVALVLGGEVERP